MNFASENFESCGSGKGKWMVQYGGITDKVKYTNENSMNAMHTIGHVKLEREDGTVLYMFISKLADQEVITTTGLAEKKLTMGKVILNSIDPRQSLDYHYTSHLNCFEGKTPDSDRVYLEKQLKKLPDRVYDLGIRAVMEAMGL